ncbi:MAG TPA: hemolysin family protein [Phycisphaerales bacterium]|nr:hemolysin family protein [Phycisphaerales bacterium]
MTAGLWLIVGLLSVAIGAIFSSLFYALHELSRNRLEELAQNLPGPARARVEAILEDPQGHSVATSLPRVVSHMLAVVAAVFFVTRLRGMEAPQWLEVTLGIFGASLIVWLFGLIIPSSIAKHAGEETILSWSRLVRCCYLLTAPFRGLVTVLDDLIGKMAGVPDDPQQAAQDQVLSVVQDAQDEGAFDEFEHDTIESVLRFRDKTVQQIMTPRTEMEAMALTDNLGEVTAQIRRTRHSRIPVYEGNPDHIVGIFYVKDLLKWLAGDKTRAGGAFDFRKLVRPALFIPETKTVREALTDMRQRKVHLAIVADEYGGTAGLVTIEDIVEQIIGDIRDEFEPAIAGDDADISVDHTTRSAEVDARLYIREVNAQLKDLAVELPESPDYDTVGGYVTVTLGRIPQPGEVVKLDGLQVTVIEGEPTHVERLRIELAPPEQGDVASPVDSLATPQ